MTRGARRRAARSPSGLVERGNRVSIELVTHDAGAVTERDVALARVISRLAE
jgi:pterin-4a-carbinolamine dehydratase